MKSEQEIRARIEWLNKRLREQFALPPGDEKQNKLTQEIIFRMQGNIGALEWVMRDRRELGN